MAEILKKRSETDSKYKWKLEDIYLTDELWRSDADSVGTIAEKLLSYQGKLASSAAALTECLKLSDELGAKLDKVFVYARMRRDEDNSEPKYQGFVSIAMGIYSQALSAIAFITPEITALSDELLEKFYSDCPGLCLYKKAIEDIRRMRSHVLSDSEERVIARLSETFGSADEIYSMLTDADMKFPSIIDADGNSVELTQGRYISFLESNNRRVREDAFNALYDTYGSFLNTTTASLSANIKKDVALAQIRRYSSSVEASLDQDNVPVSVYDNLISAVHDALPLFRRYLMLRKKLLGLDELHMYDVYTPLIECDLKDIPYERAKELVKEGLRPLGSEYASLMDKAFSESWIDVYENQGKTSGAYSWGEYGTHPYILLNYQGTINDVCTIAHEMGHALHSYYTNMTQPYVYSQYKIFVAEVASTVNESLLLSDLIAKTSDKRVKAFLINHYLEEARGTLFRQTMFAEFERITHGMAQDGQPLTSESLCDVYKKLNDEYFGTDMVVDDRIRLEWSRIPHFYSSFYVYKYATGFSAANALASKILSEGQPALERYIGFLRSGCSDYPIELLKKAGVDMTTPEPVHATMRRFEALLDEFEKLTDELGTLK